MTALFQRAADGFEAAMSTAAAPPMQLAISFCGLLGRLLCSSRAHRPGKPARRASGTRGISAPIIPTRAAPARRARPQLNSTPAARARPAPQAPAAPPHQLLPYPAATRARCAPKRESQSTSHPSAARPPCPDRMLRSASRTAPRSRRARCAAPSWAGSWGWRRGSSATRASQSAPMVGAPFLPFGLGDRMMGGWMIRPAQSECSFGGLCLCR